MRPRTLLEFGKWLLNLALALIVAGIVSPLVSGRRLSYEVFVVLVILVIGSLLAGGLLLEKGERKP
ncbi:hypothetical protein [Thermosulfurimonas sp. F29]|uniref:hypothetical protein n=1 Tax=Thermosulfurimonas sp. F29 TaxID=2867247 RepID=UPI001C83674E|nr:hypothetical protein [Thermosulfurimonas sp. F29]MBX6423996.1 hypothetical protein [Thermosulfurimonas sp. F29]